MAKSENSTECNDLKPPAHTIRLGVSGQAEASLFSEGSASPELRGA